MQQPLQWQKLLDHMRLKGIKDGRRFLLFRVIKPQVAQVKVRYRGLKTNTQQLHNLFALANLWMARGCLLANSQSKPVVDA